MEKQGFKLILHRCSKIVHSFIGDILIYLGRVLGVFSNVLGSSGWRFGIGVRRFEEALGNLVGFFLWISFLKQYQIHHRLLIIFNAFKRQICVLFWVGKQCKLKEYFHVHVSYAVSRRCFETL